MKKLLASLLVLTLPVTTFAGSVDLHAVIVQNNETTDAFTLNSESVRVAYRDEVVQDTCYRQEIVRYERVCDYNGFDTVRNILASVSEEKDKPARPPREPGTPPTRPSEPAPRPRPEQPRPTEPRPDPRPTPRPEPRPTPTPRPDPRPTPTPTPRPDPRPTPTPTPRPDPRPTPTPTPRPDPRPTPRPDPRPEPTPRPDPRPTPRPDPRPDPRPTPRPDPRPTPRPDPRPQPVCYDRPVYETVAYSCTKVVSVPYEVRESSAATVNVKMTAAPASRPQTGNCGVNFQLNGKDFSAQNTCSEYIATANVNAVANGDSVTYNYAIALFDGVKILAPLAGGLKGMKTDGDFLTAKVGTLTDASNVTLKLFVQRKKLIGGDPVLVDRALKPGEYTYQAIDDKTGTVKINLDKVLGGFESGRKHVIRLSLSVALPAGTLIPGGAVSTQPAAQNAEITINSRN